MQLRLRKVTTLGLSEIISATSDQAPQIRKLSLLVVGGCTGATEVLNVTFYFLVDFCSRQIFFGFENALKFPETQKHYTYRLNVTYSMKSMSNQKSADT